QRDGQVGVAFAAVPPREQADRLPVGLVLLVAPGYSLARRLHHPAKTAAHHNGPSLGQFVPHFPGHLDVAFLGTLAWPDDSHIDGTGSRVAGHERGHRWSTPIPV